MLVLCKSTLAVLKLCDDLHSLALTCIALHVLGFPFVDCNKCTAKGTQVRKALALCGAKNVRQSQYVCVLATHNFVLRLLLRSQVKSRRVALSEKSSLPILEQQKNTTHKNCVCRRANLHLIKSSSCAAKVLPSVSQ